MSFCHLMDTGSHSYPEARATTKWTTPLSVVGLMLLLPMAWACNGESAVTDEKIKQDLVGQSLVVGLRQPAMERLYWNIAPDQIKEWRIQRRLTDRKGGTDVIYAAVRLESRTQVLQGTLQIQYRLFDQGWTLEHVGLESKPSISEKTPPK